MELLKTALAVYVLFINVLSVIVCVYDKNAARRKKRRIRERTLFLLCFLGGSPAMYLTMLAIRHKTKHKSFMIGIPLIMLLQIAIIYCMAIDIIGIK